MRKKAIKLDQITQADISRLHNKWRKILGITMPGSCEMVDKVDENGSLGNCDVRIARNRYKIKILNPSLITKDNYPGDYPPDVENSIAHETTHVLTAWLLSKNLSKVEMELYESNVDQLAGIMVQLHRGQY